MSTKYRREVLTEKNANYLKTLHEKIANEKVVTLVTQEIMPDHVHLFITMHSKFAPDDIVKIFNVITAKLKKKSKPGLTKSFLPF